MPGVSEGSSPRRGRSGPRALPAPGRKEWRARAGGSCAARLAARPAPRHPHRRAPPGFLEPARGHRGLRRAVAAGSGRERGALEQEGKGGSPACFDSASLTRSGPAPARDDTGDSAWPRPPGDLTRTVPPT